MNAEVKPETTKKDTNKTLAKCGPRIPYDDLIEERFGIDKASWKALVEAIFPNATTFESIVLALSYCRARKLDPFKRNVHIVPIWSVAQNAMVDTIWPGIGELRTTAFRTGEYAGRGKTEFGPDVKQKVGTVEMTFPEWAQVTVYRMVRGLRVEFVGPQVYWLETYANLRRDDNSPNSMWAGRPRGQLDKCAEAAALRCAFPEEVGCDYTNDEVGHQVDIDSTAKRVAGKAKARTLEDFSATSGKSFVERAEENHTMLGSDYYAEGARMRAERLAAEGKMERQPGEEG